jgi:hypothetical protein
MRGEGIIACKTGERFFSNGMRGLAAIPALKGLTAFEVNPWEAIRDGRFLQ